MNHWLKNPIEVRRPEHSCVGPQTLESLRAPKQRLTTHVPHMQAASQIVRAVTIHEALASHLIHQRRVSQSCGLEILPAQSAKPIVNNCLRISRD